MTELLVPVDQGSRRGRYSSSALSVKKNEAAEPDSGLGEYKGEVKRTLAWVGAAVGFGGAIGYVQGIDKAIEFISGYFLEESLSIDNIFVFLLLFDYFKVPKKDELKILEYGIFGAVVLRGLFIGLGAVALENFHQLLLGFAAILYVASYKIIFGGEGGDDEEDVSENTVVKFAKAYFKSSDQFGNARGDSLRERRSLHRKQLRRYRGKNRPRLGWKWSGGRTSSADPADLARASKSSAQKSCSGPGTDPGS